ncbi:outer membrane protein assembly factor BamB family protein [Erythrobacter mangrovi]|uniref:PQQ-binding-like beta-propeller repeat protein n=1 Tax=Erythrobacter mangrovi TaxID=2739433 RepID=A0A7D3Y0J8_9SPHN|nr:PQQ-binding-like beta-propeller repeat protein [Erythrobacter mangrovi]QKG71892.1 PQQ-binding-like beta-propeller repeat protein [Erythrobacter mangrovi]
MRVSHVAVAGLAATFLASCGGGSSNGGGGGNNLPVLTVTLSEAEQTVTVPDGGSTTFGFGASYTGTSSEPIIADVVINAERYRLVGTPTGSGTSFTVNLETIPFSPGGLTTSSIFFRLCADEDCERIYPGSSAAYTLNLDIQVADWETAQRLADHRGYVNVNYKREDIVRRWQYTAADGSSFGAAAAGRGRTFLTELAADGKYYAVSLNTSSGTRNWRIDMGTDVLSDPAYRDGKVYYTSTAASGTKTPMVVDAVDGTATTLPAYNAPAGEMNQPVPYMDALFLIAGANGMVAHAYDLVNGTLAWQRDFGGAIMQSAAVAVDSSSVYAFAGPTIEILSRTTGNPTGSLANPEFAGGAQYAAAPVLGPDSRLFAFALSKSYTDASPISAWSLTSGNKLWTSAASYSAYPVYGQTLLFAINPAERRVDALQPDTGAVAYSIAIPGTGALTGSVVSTRSHLFVSTASDSYAFDLNSATRAQDWTAAVGGRLAITPDNQLIISSGTRVTSYRLW